jgi:hypothetical protein
MPTGAIDQPVEPSCGGPEAAQAVNSSALAVAQVDLATHRVVAASDRALPPSQPELVARPRAAS